MKPGFTRLIEDAYNIAIISHINPDADALGSSLALKHMIEENYDLKSVDAFFDGELGELYKPLLRGESFNPHPLSEYDLAIVLDCPKLKRTGQYVDIIENAPHIINIDHHEANTKFGEVNYVTPNISSTCEMLYLLAKKFDIKLNDLIAKQLFQGIITDTNCFTSGTSSDLTHKIVGELMRDFNFDSNKIKDYYFKNNSRAKTQLLASAIQSMKFYNNNRITTMNIDYPTFAKFNASFDDTLGIIESGINVKGTEASAIFVENKPNELYCSLRSRGNVNVGEIARQFGGGGNEKLAAFQTEKNIQIIEQELVEELGSYLKDKTDETEIEF